MPPSAFLALLVGPAQACQRATGVPASITLGQAALESGWGKKCPGNNLFGIKADRSWKGPTVDFTTREHINGKDIVIVDTFRAYSSWLDSMVDHAQFLVKNRRYAGCFKETTSDGWARAVATAGYATDPDYADELIAVMHGRKMAQYDVWPTKVPA